MAKRMSPKERVLTVLGRQEPDRVPLNYSGNAGINERIRAHFGAADFYEALGIDFRCAGVSHTGPKRHEDKGEDAEMALAAGVVLRFPQ